MHNLLTRSAAAGVASILLTGCASIHSTKNSPTLRPGPHSAVADVDLPAGTIQCSGDVDHNGCTNAPGREEWRFAFPVEDMVGFLAAQFATGPKYDAEGATSWKGLPPCYINHAAPPQGGANGTTWEWRWGEGSQGLSVRVGLTIEGNEPENRLYIDRESDFSDFNAQLCLRS